MGDDRIAVEVELAPKSKPRLDAILRLHRDWLRDKKTNRRRLHLRRTRKAGVAFSALIERVDVMPGYRLRIELLDTIKDAGTR